MRKEKRGEKASKANLKTRQLMFEKEELESLLDIWRRQWVGGGAALNRYVTEHQQLDPDHPHHVADPIHPPREAPDHLHYNTSEEAQKRKKRKKRRRKITRRKMTNVSVVLTNCKGYGSKIESIKRDIIENRSPDVLLLNETLMRGERKIKMKNYVSFCKNRSVEKEKGRKEGGIGGGVATLVADHLKSGLTKVGEGRDGDEYIITRLGQTQPAINIVNFYGENESRAGERKVLESWERLRSDIEEIEERGEAILLMGDMNRAIGSDELGIPGNKELVSKGGKLIRDELLKDGKYVLINGLKTGLVEGGPWTWVQPGRGKMQSCLDLAIISSVLLPYVKKLVIDSSKMFTPRRVMRKKTGVVSTYTDHFSLEVVMEGLPTKQTTEHPKPRWNLAKPGGWERYEKLTEEAAEKIVRVVNDEKLNEEEIMKGVDAIETKVKFKAFGKTKEATLKKQVERKHTNDEELLEQQGKAMEEEIMKVKGEAKDRVGRVYKMKKRMMGGKNAAQEPTAIRDPTNNELVVSGEMIKEITLKYCEDNLKDKKDDENKAKEDEIKAEVHKIRMASKEDDDFEVIEEDFDDVMKKFKKKDTKAYDFLTKANPKFQKAIFLVCKRFINREKFPEKFQKTMLYMISKKKGPAEILKNNRFIHMKDYLARTCEALVVNKMRKTIFEKSSKFQIGGQSGHCPEEHVFTLKSLIGHMESQGRGLILTLVDIVSFFDRENIIDVMDTLEELEVNKKACRIWFNLNENTEIAVKTAVGMTKSKKVGALVGQGSSGAAVVSQAMVDSGLKQYFSSSSDEMYYGEVRVESAAFQDDICKPCNNVVKAQAGMTKLAMMLEERGLDAHPDKTAYIVFGSESYKQKMKNEAEERPLNFGKFLVKAKKSEKYLGQILHQDGLAESAKATIKDRTAKVKGAIYATKQIIDTFEMQTMGGMMAAKQLWEGAIIPSLLAGAGTWVGATAEAEAMCDQLQELFWRVMFELPQGTPKVMLTAETASLRMKQRIWLKKLLLAKRILSQKGSLAGQIYKEQLKMEWGGLSAEVEQICKEIGVENVNYNVIGKEEMKTAVEIHCYKEMKESMENSKKLTNIKNEDFTKPQSYMEYKSVEQARQAFRVRSKMIKSVKMNFKNMHKNDLKCEKCSDKEETQEHVMVCKEWEEFWKDLNTDQIKDQVTFFHRFEIEKARMATEGRQ